MKKGEKKKQAKALAKRTERKSAKKAQQVAAAEGELRPIRQARKYPLEGCWVQSGWQEAGLAVVVVARRQPNGLLVFGNLPGGLLLPRREELFCPCRCHACDILRAAAANSFPGKHPPRLRRPSPTS